MVNTISKSQSIMKFVNGQSNRKCTQGFMGWGYMRLCCHLVGSRSLIAVHLMICLHKGSVHKSYTDS